MCMRAFWVSRTYFQHTYRSQSSRFCVCNARQELWLVWRRTEQHAKGWLAWGAPSINFNREHKGVLGICSVWLMLRSHTSVLVRTYACFTSQYLNQNRETHHAGFSLYMTKTPGCRLLLNSFLPFIRIVLYLDAFPSPRRYYLEYPRSRWMEVLGTPATLLRFDQFQLSNNHPPQVPPPARLLAPAQVHHCWSSVVIVMSSHNGYRNVYSL
jgi:hypothetical protein